MTDTTLDQPGWLDDGDAPDGQLPPRPRRKLVTPATAGLTAVIIAAAGFVGGVEAQKSSATAASTPTGGGAGARTAGFAGGPPGAAERPSNGAAGALTTGQVENKDGSTLYVTDADGNTIKVKTTSNSKISRNATADAGEIHPGDTVVIQGTTSDDGTVDASSVSATASGVSSAGGGFPGGRRSGGASTPGSDGVRP